MKHYFNLFTNDGENKDKVTFRVFEKGGSFEDVTADYRVSGGGDNPATGSGIKAKSKAGNPVIRLNVGVGEPRHYYRGTLVIGELAIKALKAGEEQPKGERAGVFGTVTDKEGTEMEVSGWVRKDKNGKPYISCSLQEPFKKGEKPEPTEAVMEEDEIPF